MNPPKLHPTPLRGGAGSATFDDTPSSRDVRGSSITKIGIHYTTYIRGLEVYYSWNNGKGIMHGTIGDASAEVLFQQREFITRIEGLADSSCIVQLAFLTNKRMYGPFGGTSADKFIWHTPDGALAHPLSCMRVVAFSGSHSGHLKSLRAIFSEYTDNTEDPTKTIRYESLSMLVGMKPPPVSPGISKSFSGFTFHLMNPIVTLYVGEERVEFHVHQDTLCRLPFFQAALLGSFKESSEQTINMPEDDPSHISALVEFIYTGNYTYTYDPDSVQLYHNLASPIGDLVEGLFHVGVYTTASKYGCEELVEIATKHFQVVVGELDCINALRLWKTAYSDGIQFPGRIKGFGQYRSREGLVAWVKELYDNHREEMEKTTSELPMLSSDLLRITTGNSY